MTEQSPVMLALLVAAIDQLDELHDKVDAILAREPQAQGEVADAVVLQLAPRHDAAKRALRRRSR